MKLYAAVGALALVASSLSSPIYHNITTPNEAYTNDCVHLPTITHATLANATNSPGYIIHYSPNGTVLTNTTMPASTLLPRDAGSKPGLLITNARKASHDYYIFPDHPTENAPYFKNPAHVVTVPAHQSRFFPIPDEFRGHIQRGDLNPATWGVFHMGHTDKFFAKDNEVHGWVTADQGMDGPIGVRAMDGSGQTAGFWKSPPMWEAPDIACKVRADGIRVLDTIKGSPYRRGNIYANQWLAIYMRGEQVWREIVSKDQRLEYIFY